MNTCGVGKRASRTLFAGRGTYDQAEKCQISITELEDIKIFRLDVGFGRIEFFRNILADAAALIHTNLRDHTFLCRL
jgi:hypothetical protein